MLGGAGVGFLQYQARTRLNEYTKQREVDSKRVDKVFAKLTEAQQQKGGVEKCVTTMNERLAKVHAAKDDPPTSIPEGAALVCDSTDWQTGCHTPSVFASNTAFSTATPCADPAVTERQKLELLSSTKPYPGDSKTDAWIQDVNATIAAHKTAQALLKPPGGIAALSSECTATALESFVDNSSGIHRQLEASTCAVSMTWVDASGNIMGRLKASGHGSPPSSARGAATLSESEMDSANAESQRNALEDGWAQIQKRIDVVNKKAGAAPKGVAPPKSPAVAPAPKAHSPAPAAPAPKSPTPTVPAPKSPAPQPPPKQK